MADSRSGSSMVQKTNGLGPDRKRVPGVRRGATVAFPPPLPQKVACQPQRVSLNKDTPKWPLSNNDVDRETLNKSPKSSHNFRSARIGRVFHAKNHRVAPASNPKGRWREAKGREAHSPSRKPTSYCQTHGLNREGRPAKSGTPP